MRDVAVWRRTLDGRDKLPRTCRSEWSMPSEDDDDSGKPDEMAIKATSVCVQCEKHAEYKTRNENKRCAKTRMAANIRRFVLDGDDSSDSEVWQTVDAMTAKVPHGKE